MTNVVHVGLGKTATTTLQKFIFPKLADDAGYVYNDPELKKLLYAHIFGCLRESEQDRIKKLLKSNNNFISMESLSSWNPALWEDAAEKNLSLFGKDTKILLTLREPKSWMISVYQQTVLEGNVVRPEYFFLPEEKYAEARKFESRGNLIEYFCPDHADFEKLHQFYAQRFNTVECVELGKLGQMDFATTLFGLDENSRENLRDIFKTSQKLNRAYSRVGMSLTSKREKILRSFRLKSLGSADRRYEHIDRFCRGTSPEKKKDRNLGFTTKMRRAISRGLRHAISFLPSWQRFIRDFVDRIIPYKKIRTSS